jgi:hypothetical protein
VFFYSPGGNALINDPEAHAETLTGVVLNGAHGIYDVHTEAGVLRCTLRGKLKKAYAQAQSAKSVRGMIKCSRCQSLSALNTAIRVSTYYLCACL